METTHDQAIRNYYQRLTEWEISRAKHLTNVNAATKDERELEMHRFIVAHEAEYRDLCNAALELRLHGHEVDMESLGMDRTITAAQEIIAEERRRHNDIIEHQSAPVGNGVETKA